MAVAWSKVANRMPCSGIHRRNRSRCPYKRGSLVFIILPACWYIRTCRMLYLKSKLYPYMIVLPGALVFLLLVIPVYALPHRTVEEWQHLTTHVKSKFMPNVGPEQR
jgi:hypothetical protein